MNLPNVLSFLRILSVPVFIWLLLDGQTGWAMWLFAGAGITDALDGFIAKRYNMETELGRYLDPLADKILLVAGFVTLSLNNLLPLWLTLLVVTRELLIIGGAMVFQVVTGDLRMEPLWISKVNTVVQILLVVTVLIRTTQHILENLVTVLIVLAGVTTILSGGVYVIRWSRIAVDKEVRKI